MYASRSLLLLLAPLPVLTGCDLFSVAVDIDLTVNPTEPLSFVLGPFSETCDDPKTRVEDENGWHEYENRIEGTNCVIQVSGEMVALDMNEIREEIDAQIEENGKDPADVTVTIETTSLTFDDIALVDGSGAAVEPPLLDAWSALFEFQGDEFASFAGTDTSSLAAAAATFELTEAQVAELNNLLNDPGPVMVAGEADLSLDFENEFKPKLATVDDPTIQFTFEVELHATAKVPIF